ncbi:hypothetical protein Tco_1535296, partial [Tanacetum coccineum]
MYDPVSLEVWSITFPVGLQIQHAEDVTTFSPFLTAALTTAFGLAVVTLLTLVVLTFSLNLLVLAADFLLKSLLTSECALKLEYIVGNESFTIGLGAAVLTGLAVLIDAAALGELCLAALTGTCHCCRNKIPFRMKLVQLTDPGAKKPCEVSLLRLGLRGHLYIPYDSPLLGVNTPRSDEGSLKLNELMDLVTKLSNRVLDLEKVKTAQAKEIAGLKRRVTKLEQRQRQRSRILKNHPFRFGSSRRQSLGKNDVSK